MSEEIKIPFLNDVEAKSKTGFKKGDKVKIVKKVGSGATGVVNSVIGPLYHPIDFHVVYKIMVQMPGRGEVAFNPEDLKKI